eukprot:3260514-Amphidinium_carterae.1
MRVSCDDWCESVMALLERLMKQLQRMRLRAARPSAWLYRNGAATYATTSCSNRSLGCGATRCRNR